MRLAVMLVSAMVVAAQPRTFEVAAVRRIVEVTPTSPASPGGPPPPPPPPVLSPTPNGMTIDGATVQYCLSWAYGVRPWQVEGPGWIRVNRYSISARNAGPIAPEQLKPMLAALLEERLRLVIRREQKESRVLALVADSGGAKLKPAAPATPVDRKFSPTPGGGLKVVAQNTPIDFLVQVLSLPLWPTIVDRTGLSGGFDFTYERPPQDRENRDRWLGDIQASLRKQLGLTLTPQRAPVETITVVSGQQDPIAN
jgi:uncharacterized protein (TIGR03435 family)